MNRAERRRQQKAEAKKQKTFTLTQAEIDKIKKEAVEEATGNAMALMLVILLEVLIMDYWPKTAYKRLPRFVDRCLEVYRNWEDGVITMEELTPTSGNMAA